MTRLSINAKARSWRGVGVVVTEKLGGIETGHRGATGIARHGGEIRKQGLEAMHRCPIFLVRS
ncbi:MAG: hypothetical protein ACYDHM_06780 [Acidiferrobacterales bacterium]